jgi:DNA-binding CsgD family transcriptional regulator
MSVSGVRWHLTRLYRQAGVKNRTALLHKLCNSKRPGIPDMPLRPRIVVTLAAMGRTNREICAVVHCAPDTVKKDLKLAFDQLGCWTRLEVAARYSASSEETHGT